MPKLQDRRHLSIQCSEWFWLQCTIDIGLPIHTCFLRAEGLQSMVAYHNEGASYQCDGQ